MQSAVLFLNIGQVQSAADDHLQFAEHRRLRIKIIGPVAHGLQCVVPLAVAGQHDDLDVRIQLQHCSQTTEPLNRGVFVGRKTQIENHHTWLMFFEDAQPFIDVTGQQDRILLTQSPFQLLADIRAIVDNQNLSHRLLPKMDSLHS